MGDPGVDPGLVGRRVQHPVGAAPGTREVEDQLGEDEAARASADLPRAGRDQRARQTLGEELAERHRPLLGAHEAPPALQLPLLVAPLVTAGEQRQQPLDEPRVLVRRDPERGHELEEEAAQHGEVLERLRQVRARHQLVAPVRLGEQDPRRAHEVLEDRRGALGDPPHRVRDVAIEAREEAEAVLGRQVRAAVGAGAGHRQAAGLAAGDVARLEHDDVEPALGQLVRCRQARDAAAEDRHPSHLRATLSQQPPLLRGSVRSAHDRR